MFSGDRGPALRMLVPRPDRERICTDKLVVQSSAGAPKKQNLRRARAWSAEGCSGKVTLEARYAK